MRTKVEIEADAKQIDKNSHLSKNVNGIEKLQLEVLLDIRELLLTTKKGNG